VTGRCLHRVRSFDHRVWSSREKRISPFVTIRLDLMFFSFQSQAPPYSLNRPSSPNRCATAAVHPCSQPQPRPRRAAAPPRPRPCRAAQPPQRVHSRHRSRAAGAPRAVRAPAPPQAFPLPRTQLRGFHPPPQKTLTLATCFISSPRSSPSPQGDVFSLD
jgi:hypothetical protein